MSPLALSRELEKKARILALMGDPTRIRVLKLLSQRSKVKVSDIAKEVSMSIACVSHHLQLLKDNGLVASKRSGNSIYYAIANAPFIDSLIKLIK
jgi:ArsR family transcriptional regulator, lead/cadmium/zinc/bismuth-responsive transcriptional repressor